MISQEPHLRLLCFQPSDDTLSLHPVGTTLSENIHKSLALRLDQLARSIPHNGGAMGLIAKAARFESKVNFGGRNEKATRRPLVSHCSGGESQNKRS